ncbi:very short patch repair endonuclease [Verrucosispora sp. NA02020]|uniref:very short patch repair endonuclease n=1 Tax=Verrucosispora sp. NA02020 TaxID=2742132 RepID=UPI00159176D1|nr:very short patch repair endonuclease [Verrucosispora sp. NA02020]QKW16945.1 very short patch repair endonuclease [Verrucosispora sp. NA02020]QKW16957.1 very short patch repair endonuclease [Verrucosispora sp. NA02020]
MPPTPPPSSASRAMRSNRSANTKPELALRQELFRRGLRYRVGYRISLLERAVRPDIVFTRRKVAVFVDGCFWHGCPIHCRMPSDPSGYWHQKIDRNRKRDLAVDEMLRAAGWTIFRVWEHEPANEAAGAIHAALNQEVST